MLPSLLSLPRHVLSSSHRSSTECFVQSGKEGNVVGLADEVTQIAIQ
jgi:hypothetical protein